MKNYEALIEELYNSFPAFQPVGSGAYKPGLENAEALDAHFGHPHRSFHTIHVGGTNGKGSTSHTLAAILQESGYRVGLYTSPHLADFRERIRINGEMIPREEVERFLTEHCDEAFTFRPSFFELTTFMAFRYFASQRVDVAIIEVGLGGRLDTTNVITPDLSIITNISLDHVALLGHDHPTIAREKAGIIKAHVPAVIGEAEGEVRAVFQQRADEVGAPIFFAQDTHTMSAATPLQGGWQYDGTIAGDIWGELGGLCQEKNAATILTAIEQLRHIGYNISDNAIREGFAHVTTLTGLQGRWQRISEHPLTICDTGHNIGGMQYIAQQLADTPCKTLHIVLGMVNDKDISGVLAMLPRKAQYYFTQASVARALTADEVAQKAAQHGLQGNSFKDVATAYQAAREAACEEDVIFVGGSTFVVADLLAMLS